MSAGYSVMLLNEFYDDENKGITFFKSCGIQPPPRFEGNRYPSPIEIQTVVDNLAGCTTKHNKTPHNKFPAWQIDVSDLQDQYRWTAIYIWDFYALFGEENLPHKFHFEKGNSEFMVEILGKLSEFCGPLVLVPNSGKTPIIVSPDTIAKEAVRIWKVL